ncbi:uridine kinase [Metschnikowia bicuspidata]|uniref:Uridine kinase n=1 Tax=Metschnikowia bicuspidata TaxID=27322 RepID=A0A4P9ZJ85_9ASCO|nr:uridine kinase [Metschnikowia bicuspidata]
MSLEQKPGPKRYTPPWTEPYIIGIGGFSGSGKTSISQKIIQELNQPWTVLLRLDNFYMTLNEEQRAQALESNYDFDHPGAIDMDLLVEKLGSLKQGEKIEIQVYSFASHQRTDKTFTIYGANVIILEGIFALFDPSVLDLMDIKVFVDTDLDVCLARRVARDILHRGRDAEGILRQWERFVKPNAVKYVYPTIRNADLVIPRGLDNTTAIDLLIQHIKKQLAAKSQAHIRRLEALGHNFAFNASTCANLHILPSTPHTWGIHSMILSSSTDRTDFIFYFDRMANLLIKRALDTLTNYAPTTVHCNKGYTYAGLAQTLEIIAISIVRTGDCFMTSVKKTIPDIPIGKLLIQSDSLTGEPHLHTESLPKRTERAKYILMDAQMIGGAGVIMAIQVLLDHKVDPRDIILVSYLLTEMSVRRLFHVFPEVTLVVGKLSNLEVPDPSFNQEGFRDSDWPFLRRFVDSLYFGTSLAVDYWNGNGCYGG